MNITTTWQKEPKRPKYKLWEFLVMMKTVFKKRPCGILWQVITKKCFKNMEILPDKGFLISVMAKIQIVKLLKNHFL